MSVKNNLFIHPTAYISPDVKIGNATKIWHNSQIRENSNIGNDCIIGKGVYIDTATKIGNKVKIQNYACLYHQTTIEDCVFIGPHVCLINDLYPRSANLDGSIKSETDWESGKILLQKGSSIGTGSIIMPNITVGYYAMVGAGSIVTKNVPPQALVFGNPAIVVGYVCKCGRVLSKGLTKPKNIKCKYCKSVNFNP